MHHSSGSKHDKWKYGKVQSTVIPKMGGCAFRTIGFFNPAYNFGYNEILSANQDQTSKNDKNSSEI